jgi:hypothetical protein
MRSEPAFHSFQGSFGIGFRFVFDDRRIAFGSRQIVEVVSDYGFGA